MPKKAFKKKKEYQKFCCYQVKKQGMVHDASGAWKKKDPSSRMYDMLVAGYHVR